MSVTNLNYVDGASASPEKLQWLATHIPPHTGRALDLGCGAGLYSKWLQKRGWRVEALDLNEPPAMDGVNTRSFNLENPLPFEDRGFDLILAWDVLEHVAKEEQLWKELSRVMKPSAILVGSVPHADDKRLHAYNLTYKHHIDKTHQREYTPRDIEKRFADHKLTSLEVSLKGPVSPQFLAEFCCIPSLRRPLALFIGMTRRMGLLRFQEFYGDVFFAGRNTPQA